MEFEMSIVLGYILLIISTVIFTGTLVFEADYKSSRTTLTVKVWSATLSLVMFCGICYYNFTEKEIIEKRFEVIDKLYVDFNGDGHLYKATHNENKKFGKTAIFRKLKYQRYGIFYPQKDYWY